MLRGHTRLLFEVLTARERPCSEAMARDADPDAALVLRPPRERASARGGIEPQGAGRAPPAVTRALRDVCPPGRARPC
jgi:hypothetical protein